MERKHADQLRERFPEALGDKPLITLRILDDYQFMDPELIELLQHKLGDHLEL